VVGRVQLRVGETHHLDEKPNDQLLGAQTLLIQRCYQAPTPAMGKTHIGSNEHSEIQVSSAKLHVILQLQHFTLRRRWKGRRLKPSSSLTMKKCDWTISLQRSLNSQALNSSAITHVSQAVAGVNWVNAIMRSQSDCSKGKIH
jgi:hypothetical protein